jgi:hypothetical protein
MVYHWTADVIRHVSKNVHIKNKAEVQGIINLFSFQFILNISYGTDRIENIASNSSSTVAFVFVAAGIYLPSCCLATIGEDKQIAR